MFDRTKEASVRCEIAIRSQDLCTMKHKPAPRNFKMYNNTNV